MLNLLELKRNSVSLIPCTCDLLTSFIIPHDLLAVRIFAVVTYTNLHFHTIIHYDKLCFGPHCTLLRYTTWKKHVKTSAHAFPLFYATYFHSSDGKAKKEGKKWCSKRWNIARHYFFAFLRIFFNDSNFGNQGYSGNDERRAWKCAPR